MKTKHILRRLALPLAALALAGLAGCASEVNPDYQVTGGGVHPFESTGEHGGYLASHGYDFSECMECHGADLRGEAVGPGGSTLRSCYECHQADDHQVDFTDASSEHPLYLREHNWDMTPCFSCHRITPAAGFTFGGTCSGCHPAESGGPGACNTCHGDFGGDPDTLLSAAPPADLWGEISTTEEGVGAHRAHLTAASGISAPVACTVCHTVPDAWTSEGHIDEDPEHADLHFTLPGDPGHIPHYEPETATCSSVYCHGDAEPAWNVVDGTWNACGSCHGVPPPAPHAQLDNCSLCHGDVIDSDGNFIDPALHINGQVDLSFENN